MNNEFDAANSLKPILAYPRISVVTPSYNQGCFIEETIKSVLNQNYPNLEYIVMDGGSTDGTIEILRKYKNCLTWFSEKDHGQSDALNKGFRMASGEVLAFINSDDVYEPGALQKVGEFFAAHPEANWLTGKCRVIDSHGSEIRQLITAYKNFWLLIKSYNVLLVIDYISQPATFWRRGLVDKAGPFDESLHFSMDYDFSLRVGKLTKLWVLNAYLACFRIHPSSKSGLIRDHFNTDLSIAQRYSGTKLLINLHRLHNRMIIFSYLHFQRNSPPHSIHN